MSRASNFIHLLIIDYLNALVMYSIVESHYHLLKDKYTGESP